MLRTLHLHLQPLASFAHFFLLILNTHQVPRQSPVTKKLDWNSFAVAGYCRWATLTLRQKICELIKAILNAMFISQRKEVLKW